ncbi:hypothetical protein TorRG33x02_131720 [Trema orientale]|uniref:Uncharacterized protein n=1 Tax=Trema orientale TaxID=63057 RepID=A0A2P5F040_TREOI|nr:hypothetical protein TorRG33x02_131720 [Trema orientale]
MNISASKFSSGCESGWTLYLDESYISETDKFKRDHREEDGDYEKEEEEEDLSMVSDASSGPPHYHEDDHEDCSSFSSSWAYKSANKDKNKKTKMKTKLKEKCRDEEHHSCLDDTASSPKKSTLSKSKASMENVLGYSQGFSTTHFKGESALEKHFGLYQSPVTKNSASEEPGDFQGGNWK